MTSISLPETCLLIPMAALAAYTVREDLKHMAIPAIPVLALSALGAVAGVAFPLGTMSAGSAAIGLALGLGLGFAARAYTRWRIGTAAFGGADIAILAGGGAMLGPQLLGFWIIGAVVLALLLAALGPLAARFRRTEIDGEVLSSLPFCPALILSWAGFWIAARAGAIPAAGVF